MHHQIVRKYIKIYIATGFGGLCSEVVRPRPGLLGPGQSAAFREVLLTKRPCDVGLSGNIWTGN
jgi:hypothetical protein